ncbi:MAG: hypothetical protein P8074_23795 [Anaerolineales bacterium]|jgi:hypothetical protein
MKAPPKRGERAQALAEAALYAGLAALLALGLLSWIPVHRARTAAIVAAHGCAQFLSQSPNPAWAARQAAQATLGGDWSATLGTAYQVLVAPPQGPGSPGGCAVYYRPPRLFSLAGVGQPGASLELFISRSEAWKARWR